MGGSENGPLALEAGTDKEMREFRSHYVMSSKTKPLRDLSPLPLFPH